MNIHSADRKRRPGRKIGLDPGTCYHELILWGPGSIGLAIGYFLDRYFHTKPWFTIIFLILGVAAAFRSLASLAKEIDKRERKK
jgi:F0F1-type ATP synthase assembly protein I